MQKRRLGLIFVLTIAGGVWTLAQQPNPPAGQNAGRGAGPAVGQGAPGAAGAAAGRQGGRGGRGAAPRVRKTVLAWADTRNGVSQHESVTRALAMIAELGYRTGSWDTQIRTDSHIISKSPMRTDGTTPASGGPNLNNVDAIFFMGHREVPIDAKQKEDLLSFVRDDGKGFVAAHVGLTAFESWPEFGELIGARFDNHPIVGDGVVINEDTTFPATRHFPARFAFNDEYYQPKEFSRDKIHVLLRLDLTGVAPRPGLNRTDGDHPLAWAKTYGKGRVFYGSFGHANPVWDIADVQRMYYQAMLWALGMTDGTVAPHPMRGAAQ